MGGGTGDGGAPLDVRSLLYEALSRSVCRKHPVAAVIVNSLENYILGWNGPPANEKDHKCLRKDCASGIGMEVCPSIHAERRAISYAARDGMKIRNSTLYLNEWFPCADCAKSIIAADIIKVVTPDEIYACKITHELVPKLQKQAYNFELAEKLLREAGIELIVVPEIKF
jgi:deoxycytidylate deaminase